MGGDGASVTPLPRRGERGERGERDAPATARRGSRSVGEKGWVPGLAARARWTSANLDSQVRLRAPYQGELLYLII